MKFLPRFHVSQIALILSLHLFSASVFAKKKSHTSSPEPEGKLNQFVDFMLGAFRKMVVENHLQPFAIPDITRKFSKRVVAARVSGEATLFDGSIVKGLETVTRTGPTTLVTKRNRKGSKRTISVEFELTDLVVDENYRLKFMKMGPTGGLEIKLDKIRMFIEMVIKTHSHRGNSNINVKLGRVEIVEFSPLVFSLEGLGPLNFFVKIFTSVIAKLCKQAILHSIWNAAQQVMTQAINDTTADSSVGLVTMMMKFL